MNRRRAITLLGAATLTSCRRTNPLRTFSDIAFGTDVGFQTHGISEAVFEKLSAECASRLREMESLFSLYDPGSTLSKLNREGRLDRPPAEFLALIQTALEYGGKTGGIFDITVQPLWDWRQKWKEANLSERTIMESTTWDEAIALVGYGQVSADENAIIFGNKGMGITLNAIVQGYATDRIAALLRKGGVTSSLVNIGEYAAMGNAPDGKPWSVEFSASGERIALPSGRALAVSAGSGHIFHPEGRFHHIFRPADGANTRPDSTIAVTAPTATMADALSTTLAIATKTERMVILGNFPKADFREVN
jgi:thiamine biosynthesis lipoprotein